MLDQTYTLPQSAHEILGDLSALATQLGGSAGLDQLCATAAWNGSDRIGTVSALGSFLEQYTSAILLPHEIPAVVLAHGHGTRLEPRELIALDQQLSQVASLRPFARASWAVGQTQLRRLRPLRGERVIQRYAEAVESGRAHGWHTLVFGLVLGAYSLPLRQGLVHFTQRTLGGFVEAARDRFTISEQDRVELLARPSSALGTGLDQALSSAWPVLPISGGLSSNG